MSAAYRKKLIEVALPLEAINKASAREKSIRHGHPSTLHLWWARRPLAACRAVLFASLVDDPDSDPMFAGDEDLAASKRAELFNLIEELVQWENSNNPRVINRARAEIARCVATQKIEEGVFKKDEVLNVSSPARANGAGGDGGRGKAGSIRVSVFDIRQMLAPPEQVNAFLAEYAPPVLDPFCGGGSIPLEAQRLGLRAYASDLNPVAVLITKALIEIPPKFAGMPPVNPEWQKKSKEEKAARVWEGAQGLAEDVRYYGKWMRDEAEKRIGHLYPKVKITEEMAKNRADLKEYVGQELTVIAWLWARTVPSPNPACGGVHVPLVRSYWLSTKKTKRTWVQPVVDRVSCRYYFDVRCGSPTSDFNPSLGTVSRNRRTCLISGDSMPLEYVRQAAQAGHMRVRLMALVVQGVRERLYLPPIDDHSSLALGCAVPESPDADLVENARYMTPTIYGMTKYRSLFSPRQLVAMSTLCELARTAYGMVQDNCVGNGAYADAVLTYLAFCISKVADLGCSLVTWRADRESSYHTFGRQALPMVWDYAELNPLLDGTGSIYGAAQWTAETVGEQGILMSIPGESWQKDAVTAIQGQGRTLLSTDPPYYDNVPYADLSDFFYIWLRHILSAVYPEMLGTLLVPKNGELVADTVRQGGREESRQFFERGVSRVFRSMANATYSAAPATIYYAFKQAENDGPDTDESEDDTVLSRVSTGWETFLQGLVDAGWQITGTWPTRTELSNRTRGMSSNALASSIVLVCRPRSENAKPATRKDFINALRRELPEALRDLQRGSIAPVDLAQAAIGPGMSVFTRYLQVMETNGSPMAVRTALGVINQALDEVLAEQEGEFDGDTRWALAWFEQFGMDEGAFGVAETLSKAKNTAVNGLVEAGIIKARGGKVRLLNREELPQDWDPAKDKRLTVWEVTQHLIRTLDQQGESGAAALMHRLGGMAETARDLAYRLYTICERKKWADEALAYNGLVIAWPELTKLAQAERSKARESQQEMF